MSKACSTNIALRRPSRTQRPWRPCGCCGRRLATPAGARSPGTCAGSSVSWTVAASRRWRAARRPCAACTARDASICRPRVLGQPVISTVRVRRELTLVTSPQQRRTGGRQRAPAGSRAARRCSAALPIEHPPTGGPDEIGGANCAKVLLESSGLLRSAAARRHVFPRRLDLRDLPVKASLPPAARLAAPARGRRSAARPAAGAGRRAGPGRVRGQRTGPGAAG